MFALLWKEEIVVSCRALSVIWTNKRPNRNVLCFVFDILVFNSTIIALKFLDVTAVPLSR